MIKKTLLAVFLALFLISPAFAELKVVTTLPWIGSLAKEIGGEKISVTTLVKPNQDPHYIEAKPSMILAARKADIMMYNSLDLEVGYLPLIIESSKNTRIQPGQKGNLDCGQFVNAIEKSATFDRSQGDVHPLGNPHYHLSPSNMARVAEGISDALSASDSGNTGFYRANLTSFKKKLETKRKEWEGKLKGKRFVAFHRHFEYLAHDQGFRITGYIEPETVILYEHEGDSIVVTAGKEPVRFLLFTGRRLGEPVAWRGPIVMNTEEELREAFEEYDNGTFVK